MCFAPRGPSRGTTPFPNKLKENFSGGKKGGQTWGGESNPKTSLLCTGNKNDRYPKERRKKGRCRVSDAMEIHPLRKAKKENPKKSSWRKKSRENKRTANPGRRVKRHLQRG